MSATHLQIQRGRLGHAVAHRRRDPLAAGAQLTLVRQAADANTVQLLHFLLARIFVMNYTLLVDYDEAGVESGLATHVLASQHATVLGSGDGCQLPAGTCSRRVRTRESIVRSRTHHQGTFF